MSSCLNGKLFMQRRRHAQVELPGEMFAWLNALFGAHFEQKQEGQVYILQKIKNVDATPLLITSPSEDKQWAYST
jgi:hypothetical protein